MNGEKSGVKLVCANCGNLRYAGTDPMTNTSAIKSAIQAIETDSEACPYCGSSEIKVLAPGIKAPSEAGRPVPRTKDVYVDLKRIDALGKIKSEHFDLAKLIRLCEELNKSYADGNYLSTAMLLRALLDHVPPIFGCRTFPEVANNYKGTRSFKEAMANLDGLARKIADSHLHEQIRAKETLPNKTQVDFKPGLDMLLAEVIRLLK